MRRHEAVAALCTGTAMTVVGLTWLFGAVALAACGVAVMVVSLCVDVGGE